MNIVYENKFSGMRHPHCTFAFLTLILLFIVGLISCGSLFWCRGTISYLACDHAFLSQFCDKIEFQALQLPIFCTNSVNCFDITEHALFHQKLGLSFVIVGLIFLLPFTFGLSKAASRKLDYVSVKTDFFVH